MDQTDSDLRADIKQFDKTNLTTTSKISSSECILEEIRRLCPRFTRKSAPLKNFLEQIYSARIFREKNTRIGFAPLRNDLIFHFENFNTLFIPADKCSPLFFACLDTVVSRSLRTTFGTDVYEIHKYPATLAKLSSGLIATIDPETLFNPPKQKILDIVLDWLHKERIKNIKIYDDTEDFVISFESIRTWNKKIKEDRVWHKEGGLNLFAARLLSAGDLPVFYPESLFQKKESKKEHERE